MTVRLTTVRDVPHLHTLFMQSVDTSFDYFASDYRRLLRQQHSRMRFFRAALARHCLFFLAYADGSPVGYSLTRMDGPHRGFIHWMYVDPTWQGRGVGKLLLEVGSRALRERGVREVRLLTHDQVAFYEHHGFAVVRALADTIGGVGMVLMERQLS